MSSYKNQFIWLFKKDKNINKCDYCENFVYIRHWDGTEELKLCEEHAELWLNR